jgi:hypothetical protein
MSETIRVLKAIGAEMTALGWDKNGSPGAVKRDEAGKIVAKWGSPEFTRDLDNVKEALIAREAVAEIKRRSA